MSKELYIAATEEIIEELMAANPGMTWGEAYEKSADLAYDRYRDKFADLVDAARSAVKEATAEKGTTAGVEERASRPL